MDKHRKLKSEKKSFDYILFAITLAISVFGIIMVFDSSINLSSDKYHFVILQSIWVFIGIIGMIILSKYDYHKLAKLSLPLMVLAIIGLITTLLLNNQVNGAVRWISLAGFQIQPSELIKPILIIYLSSWFSKERDEKYSKSTGQFKFVFFNEFLPFMSILILITGLVILGKDLGTAIIISSIALGMYFINTTNIFSLINFIFSLITLGVGGVLAILTQSYRLSRITDKNPLKGGYQIQQILIAIGSGGFWGKGFTQSIQKQRYLVETTAATDSIFAVIAEEFGLIGSCILFFAYVALFYRTTMIALRSKDLLGKYIAMGISIWIMAQALLNIAVNVNLVPLTGVPLPLISYGGSSTISVLFSIGILLNISRQISYSDSHN